MKATELGKHSFCFSPLENSGEGLFLKTTFYGNGDVGPNGLFVNQEITLNSYQNSASINLFGIPITSTMLRQLADELDVAKSNALFEYGKNFVNKD